MNLKKWVEDILNQYPTSSVDVVRDEWYGVANGVDVLEIALAVKQLQAELDNIKSGHFCPIPQLAKLATTCNCVHLDKHREAGWATINRLQAELDKYKQRLMRHAEALTVLELLRQTYKIDPQAKGEHTKSACMLLIQQCDEGLRLSRNRRQEDYISQIQAENEIFKVALVKLSKLGNGEELGNSDGNIIAQQALKGKGEQ